MPVVRPDVAAFGVLFLCVPLQYILVKYWGHSETGRTHALNEFINNLVQFRTDYLRWESWKHWCSTVILNSDSSGYDSQPSFDDDPMGESPAIEVMKYKQKEGYFGLSPEQRLYRPPHVKFRVGQVVTHKYRHYRGVIIGWDEVAKAPDVWLESMYGNENKKYRNMPNYAVLVDVRDRLSPQITYVPEDILEPLKHTKIIHPLLDDHFEKFDGAQYIPRPWLRTVYPKD